MSPDDDRERGERPKRSWREIDQMRDGARRREERPRSARAELRAGAATKQYLAKLDKHLFSEEKGGAAAEPHARAVREAHGTAGLPAACRAYLEALGPPSDPALLALFLDARDAELVKVALGALRSLQVAGRLTLSSGVRSQLRLLQEDPDDDVAYAAEELLSDGAS